MVCFGLAAHVSNVWDSVQLYDINIKFIDCEVLKTTDPYKSTYAVVQVLPFSEQQPIQFTTSY